jgi:hypothetical protein
MFSGYGVLHVAERDVLARYGLLKTAGDEGLLTRAGNLLFRQHPIESWWHFAPELGREMVLGSPLTLYDRMKELHGIHKSLPKAYLAHARDYYWHPDSRGVGAALNAVNLATSGYDLYSAAAHGPENRYGDLSAGLAGLALSPITGHLGVAGMPLHVAIENGVRRIGHSFDPATTSTRPYTQPTSPAPHVRRVLRTMNAPGLPEGSDTIGFG